jgi:hypothetical protein
MVVRVFSEELVDMILSPGGERLRDSRKSSNRGASERNTKAALIRVCIWNIWRLTSAHRRKRALPKLHLGCDLFRPSTPSCRIAHIA